MRLENQRAKGIFPRFAPSIPFVLKTLQQSHSHRDTAWYSQGMDGHGHIPTADTAAEENVESEKSSKLEKPFKISNSNSA